MDPNANLKEQAELLQQRRPDGSLHSYDRYRLYDLRTALQEWIGKGGFEPTWSAYPDAAAAFRVWQDGRS